MQLADLPWPVINELPRETPVVFPVAALEQHGHHLPVFTDSLLLGEIVRRAAAPLEARVLFAPLLWLGNSDHHLDFPGTLSAPPRAYLDLIAGVADNFMRHGFSRLIFINGHGGNDVPGKQALFELRQRLRAQSNLLLLWATYWNLGPVPLHPSLNLRQSEMGHACEWETSMVLRLAPRLVRPFQEIPATSTESFFAPASRAWITKDRTTPGHLGSPAEATAEKGEFLFHTFSQQLVDLLEKVLRWDGRSWAS